MAERFQISDTPLDGLKLVERCRMGDARGFFSRFYCADELQEAGLQDPVVQINHTATERRGTVRGMHFQKPPHAEDKIVSVLRGDILDVAVDLRRGSPTFLRWHGEHLSAQNGRSMLIPKGFAHGFQTLTDDCELIYLHTARYAPDAEGGLDPLDPLLAIDWPLADTYMSERDRAHPPISQDFDGITQ